MKNILVVEDNPEMQLLIQEALNDYDLDMASSVQEAKNYFQSKSYNLVLLDIQLPDGDGLKLLTDLTKGPEGLKTPIYMLTSESDVMKKVAAFSVGAQDYICKPFDPIELKARVSAKLKLEEQKTSREERVAIGDLLIDTRKQKCWIKKGALQTPICLTATEFKLLINFSRHPERVYSRDFLLDEVWGNAVSVTDRTVDTHVANLRKKLHGSKVKIETVVGEGYRLTLESIL